jgi:hypothetical protein
MFDTAFAWFRTLGSPLRSAGHAARWVSQLPPHDPIAIQQAALDLIAAFPSPMAEIGPAQAEALLRVDSRLEPVIAELTRQYTSSYQKSSSIESRLWHAAFDLVKAFIAAYQETLKAGYPRAENKRWRAVLPWVLVRLAHYKGLDGKFRLFRYSHWIPGQWHEFHELYEFARMRGWQREQLVFGAGAFARPGISLEQEYLKALLLMRLDSGNFTPDQVEWVARQLDDWSPSLTLVPPPGEGATFYVDLTGTQGLRRRSRPHTAGRVLMLDTGPIYGRVVERLRWLPERDEETHAPGDLPAREQRLLLMRLASLFGPDAIASAPRAERVPVDGELRVVVGLAALTRAVAEVERMPDGSQRGTSANFDEVTEIVAPTRNPDSIARNVRGSNWKLVDRSDTGCRLLAPTKDAPNALGELIGMYDGDHWTIAVVRRMQRQQVDEVTIGAEIVARRIVRVMMRNWSTPSNAAPGAVDRPFFALYLPVHPDNRQSSQRSLIGPDDRFVTGGMVELDTGSARYLIRFTQTLERQGGWAWALFSAVRKLAS